jgi:type I restriction enzyme M protein
MLVHYHAYGDAEKVPTLIAQHSGRILTQISLREQGEVERLEAEYQDHAERLTKLDTALAGAQAEFALQTTSAGKKAAETILKRLEAQRIKAAAKIAERDERIAETRRRAEDDRQDVIKVGEELIALYADPDELLKHARVVGLNEITENEFNLNIPRYVDTFEPEPKMEVKEALEALYKAESELKVCEAELLTLLEEAGYAE